MGRRTKMSGLQWLVGGKLERHQADLIHVDRFYIAQMTKTSMYKARCICIASKWLWLKIYDYLQIEWLTNANWSLTNTENVNGQIWQIHGLIGSPSSTEVPSNFGIPNARAKPGQLPASASRLASQFSTQKKDVKNDPWMILAMP